MNISFNKINSPVYTGDIKSTFDSIKPGIFEMPEAPEGALLKMDLWRLDIDEEIVGYGWMDICNSECEISFVVKEEYRSRKDIKAGKLMVKNLEYVISQENVCDSIIAIIKMTNPYINSVVHLLYSMGYKFVNVVGEELPEQRPNLILENEKNTNIYLYKSV